MDNCSDMSYLLESSIYKGLCIFKLVTCILAVISISWSLSSLQGFKWLVHCNANFLYTLNMMALFLSSVGYGICYAYDCYRLFFVDLSHPCNSMIDRRFSFHALMITVSFDSAQVWIFFSLALERLYASYHLSTYGKIQKPNIWIILNAFLILIILGLLYLLLWLPVDVWDGTISAFSVFPVYIQEIQVIYTYLHTVVEMAAILIFHYVYYRNRRGIFGRYRIGLAENYQKTENKKISMALLPIFYLHFMIYLVNFGGLGTMNLFMPIDADPRIVIYGEYFAWTTIYGVVMPVILKIMKERRDREQSRRMTLEQQNQFVPLDELFTLHLRPKSGKASTSSVKTS